MAAVPIGVWMGEYQAFEKHFRVLQQCYISAVQLQSEFRDKKFFTLKGHVICLIANVFVVSYLRWLRE